MSTKTSTKKLKALFTELQSHFPNALGEIKPLIPEVKDEMIAELGDNPLAAQVKKIMRFYMHSYPYLLSVVRRKWFRNNRGTKVRLITPEEKQKAQNEINVIHNKYASQIAENRFAIALAKETHIDFEKARLMPNTLTKDKALVIIKKKAKTIDS